jgi:predicted enzyme related to lactoylglutathione lyase
MKDGPMIKMSAFTLDCKDHRLLAGFYAALMNWEIAFHDEDYAVAAPPGAAQGAYPGLTFQRNPDYEPPVWPEEAGAQQQMAHIDFAVDDLDKAVQHARKCGATVADRQFSDSWTVMLDPAGHPFCLCEMKRVFESPGFALQ